LHEQRRLIPIDVFVGNATGLVEAHHHHVRQHNLAAGRRYAWKKDAHFPIMGEADNQLVNYAVLSNGTRYGLYLNVIGPMADEM